MQIALLSSSMTRRLTLLLILSAIPAWLMAYYSSYEERIGKQLGEGRLAAEVLRISTNGSEFVALYRAYNTEKPRGAVILLHAMGGHPDWPQVINPLRLALPELGWASLSLQMPILAPGEPISDYGRTMPEAKQRIRAAVRQLQEWGFGDIIIIGYSFGAATGAHALAGNDMADVKAFVGISMQAQQFLNPRLRLLKQLQSIDLPVLDIYGSQDMLEVRREADDRRLAGRQPADNRYRQMLIEGADHYFTGLDSILVKRIHGWMAKLAPARKDTTEAGPMPPVTVETAIKQEEKTAE